MRNTMAAEIRSDILIGYPKVFGFQVE
jgi:hypothetical protein